MPNWCACSLRVVGDEKHLQVFYTTLNGPNGNGTNTLFSFYHTVPSPKVEGFDRYTWRRANWGTKWDACDVKLITQTTTEFLIQFDTAWSPPFDWLRSVSCMFPELLFRLAYCEAGMQLYGTHTYYKIEEEIRTIEYKFLPGDTLSFENSDDDDVIPDTRLDLFMKTYSIAHTGG